MKINVKYNSNYFWRIIFVMMMTVLHCNWLNGHRPGWYLCVEYFFMISGYFLMDQYERKKEEPFTYIWKKIIKLYPHQLFSFIILFLWSYRGVIENRNLRELLRKLILHLGEALPFTYFFSDYESLGTTFLNYPVWYISVLLFVSLVFYGLLYVQPVLFNKLVVPASIILTYRYIYYYCDSINLTSYEGILINGHYLRGIGAMACGCMIYGIVKRLREYTFTSCFFKIVRIVEITSMLGVIGISWFWGNTKSDVFLVFMMTIGVTCSFIYSDETVLSGKIVKKVHKVTYPVYFNHVLLFSVLNSGMFPLPANFFVRYVIFIFIAVPYSIFTDWFVGKIVKKAKKTKKVFLA